MSFARSRPIIVASMTAAFAAIAAFPAHATPSNPNFYTRAVSDVDTNIGDVITDTGANSSAVSSSVNPITAISYCNGGCITTGDSSALANLSTVQLHAQGGLTGSDGIHGFATSETAQLGDTLLFSRQGATSGTITTVGFDVHVHGILSATPPFSDVATNTNGQIHIYVGSSFSSNWSPTESNINEAFQFNSDFGDPQAPIDPGPYTIDFDIPGSFSFTGALAYVPIELGLGANAQFGYSDFGNTATFQFDSIPDGVTYSSASGTFLSGSAAAVPEPMSASLVVLGLAGLAVARRRHGVGR